jgi:hypothetical protein
MGKVADQQFVNKIYGPEYVGYYKDNDAVVIVPADH